MRIGRDHIGLCELIKSLGKSGLVVVEIGVSEGHGTESILSTGLVDKIFSIDPWDNINPITADPCTTADNKRHELNFDAVVARNPQITKHKGTIDTFVDEFKNILNTIDVVYIDGNHSYESVCHDIDVAANIIRPKLAISGHDFADFPGYIQGVKRAVIDKLGNPDAVFCDTSWIKYLNK